MVILGSLYNSNNVLKGAMCSHHQLCTAMFVYLFLFGVLFLDRVNCYFQMKPSAPFGGYKLSGIGRDLGEESLRSYTEVKSVVIKTS